MRTTKIIHTCFILVVVTLWGCNQFDSAHVKNQYGLPMTPQSYNPQIYKCNLLTNKPKIDGVISDEEWGEVEWSSPLIYAVGKENSDPVYSSKFKLACDSDSLYFAAIMYDDHIWSIMDICESYFFDDNFLELVIDYDNDEFDYLILKFNALSNFCGEYYHSNKKKSLFKFSLLDDRMARCAVYVNGTVNNPKDIDEFWIVEASIPLNLEFEGIQLLKPNKNWKINVRRTRWTSVIVSGIYKKIINSDTGKKYPGQQWIWNNMGENPINMVELWGECQFETNNSTSDWEDQILENRKIKWELRNVFYAQQLHLKKHGRYARKVAGLKDVGFDLSSLIYRPGIQLTDEGFKVSIQNTKTRKIWMINETGKIIVIPIES